MTAAAVDLRGRAARWGMGCAVLVALCVAVGLYLRMKGLAAEGFGDDEVHKWLAANRYLQPERLVQTTLSHEPLPDALSIHPVQPGDVAFDPRQLGLRGARRQLVDDALTGTAPIQAQHQSRLVRRPARGQRPEAEPAVAPAQGRRPRVLEGKQRIP